MGWVLTFSIQKDHRSQKSEVDEAQLAAQGIYSQLPRVILTLPLILPLWVVTPGPVHLSPENPGLAMETDFFPQLTK